MTIFIGNSSIDSLLLN